MMSLNTWKMGHRKVVVGLSRKANKCGQGGSVNKDACY